MIFIFLISKLWEQLPQPSQVHSYVIPYAEFQLAEHSQ